MRGHRAVLPAIVLFFAAAAPALAGEPSPSKSEKFTFFIYGDTRTNPNKHARVADALLAEAERLKQFTFVLHTGDFADTDSGAEEFERQFFQPAAKMLARLPLLSVRGNHDCESAVFDKRLRPAGVAWGPTSAWDYCFDYGSVRLVVLDQYDSLETDDRRMQWVAEQLSGAPDRWRLVVFHEPIYSTGHHGANTDFRKVIEPLLVKRRVHAVFSGHDHAYERLGPINGIAYLVAGGGGAPFHNTRMAHPAPSVKHEDVLHFLTVTVSPDKLTVKAFKPPAAEGSFEEFDSVEISRDCGWPASIPAPHVEYGERYEHWEHRLWVAGSIAALLLGALVVRRLARRKPAA